MYNVLHSIVPEQVLRTRNHFDLSKTIFIVASKSGGTNEPIMLMQYFYDEVKKAVGDKVGEYFIAITDPGSSNKTAQQLKFRQIYYRQPTIAGRFSALSNFGMVPSAVIGYDVMDFLKRSQSITRALKTLDAGLAWHQQAFESALNIERK